MLIIFERIKLSEYLLEMKNISMIFPGVKALDDVSITLKNCEILGLVGENGAGKSTLIKILSGVYKPTEGEILFSGQKINIESPTFAIEKGIATVHQEINMEPYLSVAENIFLGKQYKNKFGLIDHKKMKEEAQRFISELSIDIKPDSILSEISVAEQQMVAIAKAISLHAKVIIFDEPAASLSKKETDSLFAVIKKIKEKGISVIYISHRLEEIKNMCDTVWVLRDGKVVGNKDVSKIEISEIVKMMIGRNIDDIIQKRKKSFDKVVLEVNNITAEDNSFRNVSLTLYEGEILTLAGLVGSGRSEVGRAIFGDNKYKGEIKLYGKNFAPKKPIESIKSKIGYVSEERKEQGLILPHSVAGNISMAVLKSLSLFGMFRNTKKENSLADEYVDKFRIKTRSLSQAVGFLSGGNQQKVVIAKWLSIKPKILIVDEVTRGVDVGAKMGIYKLLEELTRDGVSILMISSDLPEVLLLSDRILVMREGIVAGCVLREDASEESIIKYATGQVKDYKKIG